MIKKIIAVIALVFSTVAFSQENSASPYSYYGVGDVKFKGTVDTRSMGGLGILPDSIHLNLQNPATYGHLKFTTFTIAGSIANTKFKSATEKDEANRTTLDYLAVGIPFKKFGVSFGLLPYTSVGYKIENTVTTNVDGTNYTRFSQFHGTGGLNRVFAGLSYRITPKFSVGADFQYHFGNIETKSIVGMRDNGVQYPTREVNKSNYGGISFNIGAVYQTKFNEKLDWTASATFMPASTLNSSITRETATITYSSSGNEVVVNDPITQSIDDDEVKLPSRLTFGSGIGEARKWFAGAEYTFQDSNELGNRFDNVTIAGFESGHKIAVGGYYIPNYMSFNSYLSRITYRAGLKYEKTGLVVNNESINDYGFTLGLGLPLSQVIGASNLNIGFEMGRRGTTTAGLIQENYMNVFVSLSLNDRWFIKRRFE
jgi:hypothetical protein